MNRFRSRGIGVVVSLGRALARRELLRTKKSSPTDASLAARMGRVLLTVEDEALANARPCPICHASPSSAQTADALAHGTDCELDAVLAAASARSDPDMETP